MLLTKTIKIIINPKNDKTYLKLGYYDYEKYKNNEYLEIEINIEHLNHTSKNYVKVKCDICDEEKEIQYYNYWKNIKKYNIYTCSQKCAQIKNKKTNLKRYGTEWPLSSKEIKEKIKNTLIDLYGVDNPMEVKEIKEKAENTLLENYGVKIPMQNEEIKEKQHKTMKELYGSEHALQVDEFLQKNINTQINKTEEEKQVIVNKRENTTFENYGVKNITHDINLKNIIHDKTKEKYKNDIRIINIENKNYTVECNCGHTCIINYHIFKYRLDSKSTICTICNPINSKKSGSEFALRNYIESIYDDNILINKRFLNKKELDIYLPDLKVAFEFNGLYWHNNQKLPYDYHYNKTKDCEKIGIKLTHIYEDDWIYKNDIVKSLIKQKLNIFDNIINSTETVISLINENESEIFLNKNHIQGYINSDVNIGLKYNDKIVSLMSFKKNKNNYNIIRCCDIFNIKMENSFSKILEYFTLNFKFNKIFFIINKDFDLKLKNFNLIKTTLPNKYFIFNDKKISNLKIKTPIKIYNSGNFKYILKK